VAQATFTKLVLLPGTAATMSRETLSVTLEQYITGTFL
jgi:hypothetical protein